METRAPRRTTIVLSAGFALVCIVLLIVVYTSIGGSVPLAPQGYRFTVGFPDAGNLAVGSDVDIAGVKVGQVASVVLSRRSAVATIELKPAYAPLHSRASAMIRTKTLLGETYVELAPGPQNAPMLADGARLPADQVTPTVTVNDFLSTFSPHERAEMRAMFGGLAVAFAGQGSALNADLGEADPVAGNLTAVAGQLSQETGQLQSLVDDSGTVLTALATRQGDLRAAATAADEVLATTASRNRALVSTVDALPPFLTQLTATSRTLQHDSPQLALASGALVPVADRLPTTLNDFDTYVPQFRSLFRALPATVSAAQHGLPALTQILTAVPGAFAPFDATARQLIPIVQLFATYREEALVAPIANTESVMNHALVGAGGRIVEAGAGALFLSNESFAGWVRRLPTNRENPYPEPDGFADLAKLGYDKSYDCRNIHNPEYLPPLGTGVPPCVTQGPWNYRGTTAYYPRLQPTPP